MRVKDLIEELQRQDPEARVMVLDDDWKTMLQVAEVTQVKAQREIDSNQYSPAPKARKHFERVVLIK